jgi:glycine betaine/proline transport system permease protein
MVYLNKSRKFRISDSEALTCQFAAYKKRFDIESAMFQSIPPLIFLMIIGLMTWQVAGRKIAIYSISALTLIGFVGAWKEAMVTLSLVVTAVEFCVAIGIPIGIACARSDRLVGFVRPLLDVMQTVVTSMIAVPGL